MRGFSNKQKAFIMEYLKDSNGTQAAIRAGYSERTAYSIASQLLADDRISQEIKERLRILEKKSEVTISWVIGEISDIAREARAAFDFANSLRALELLGKYLGAFAADNKRQIDMTMGIKSESIEHLKDQIVRAQKYKENGNT